MLHDVVYTTGFVHELVSSGYETPLLVEDEGILLYQYVPIDWIDIHDIHPQLIHEKIIPNYRIL